MSTRPACLPWLLSLLAACSGVQRPANWHATMSPPPAVAWAAAGPFSPLVADAVWGVGDTVTYAIDIDDAGRHRGFTFSLTTRQLPASGPRRDPWVHPVFGRKLTATSIDQYQWAPEVSLWGRGEALVWAELRGDDGSRCAGVVTTEAIAHLWVERLDVAMRVGVPEMFGALLGLDCLHTELLRVVRRPSLASVLGNFGRITVGLEWPEIDSLPIVESPTPFGVLPTAWRPITLTANGQPALDGRIQFTWKWSPLLIAAGVLQVEAWHPDEPTRRITVRLQSAVRGTPPDAFAPDELGYGLRIGMTAAEVHGRLGGQTSRVVERGVLGDGRAVELVEFEVPGVVLFGVLHDGRLLFASAGEHAARHFLRVRGFRAG